MRTNERVWTTSSRAELSEVTATPLRPSGASGDALTPTHPNLTQVPIAELAVREGRDVDSPSPPPTSSGRTELTPPFSLVNSNGEVVGQRAAVTCATFEESCPLPMSGDVRIEVRGKDEEKELFHFYFNAAMLEGRERLIRRKWMLDGAKDPKHKKYEPHFQVRHRAQERLPCMGARRHPSVPRS